MPRETVTAPTVVVFGKLPSRGDFLTRGLEGEALDAWDAWFSAQMDAARNRLGSAFAAVHDAAPPWRFVDGPGSFGAGWRAGAFAPSIDSVGRRFFIMAAVDRLDAAAATRGGVVAQAMEDVIYEAFEQGWDADGLVARGREVLSQIVGAGPTADGEPSAFWETSGGPTLAPSMFSGRPADVIGSLPSELYGDAVQ